MNYQEIFDSLSSAIHVYAGVSPDEHFNLSQDSWVTIVDNVTYIGTLLPVVNLVAKEIVRSAEDVQAESAKKLAEEIEAAAQTENEYTQAIENMLNDKAKEKRYSSIITAALRAGYPGPFHNEGVAYASWMDACWAKGYSVMADVKNGVCPMPTIPEMLAMMPNLVLPT